MNQITHNIIEFGGIKYRAEEEREVLGHPCQGCAAFEDEKLCINLFDDGGCSAMSREDNQDVIYKQVKG